MEAGGETVPDVASSDLLLPDLNTSGWVGFSVPFSLGVGSSCS